MNREKHFHPLAALHLLRKTLLAVSYTHLTLPTT